MAVYVVLAFADESQAKTLVEDMLRAPTKPILTPSQENDVYGEVVGVFKKPTMFCECGPAGNQWWQEGRKWGWQICVKCGKPGHQGSHRYPDRALGRNLIPAKHLKLKYRRHPQHTSSAEWELNAPVVIESPEGVYKEET